MATFPLTSLTGEITCDRFVKDTLNVGFYDRKTDQHAIFTNENNVYYGSFVGQAKLVGNGEDSSIENYQIANSTLLSCDFVDLKGENVGLAEFKEDVVTSINDIRENLEGISSFLSSPFPGFQIETISADENLRPIWDEDFDLASQAQTAEAISSAQYALRYIFQRLGRWMFSTDPQSGLDPSSGSGGNQYIRY